MNLCSGPIKLIVQRAQLNGNIALYQLIKKKRYSLTVAPRFSNLQSSIAMLRVTKYIRTDNNNVNNELTICDASALQSSKGMSAFAADF